MELIEQIREKEEMSAGQLLALAGALFLLFVWPWIEEKVRSITS